LSIGAPARSSGTRLSRGWVASDPRGGWNLRRTWRLEVEAVVIVGPLDVEDGGGHTLGLTISPFINDQIINYIIRKNYIIKKIKT
jgi:hypothetical protein